MKYISTGFMIFNIKYNFSIKVLKSMKMTEEHIEMFLRS